ncbi:GNAT family protein [Brevibacillus laterosporus]|uniref:GNAT family N-acetyltransferase n=1 Tax=Brevibacillus laterosporus TaxID=1465 RepID=UPI003D1AD975
MKIVGEKLLLSSVRENYLRKIEESDEGSSYDFIVTIAGDQSNTPIGLAQIWSYVEHRKSWEIGFSILPAYGGQGYGSEAAKLLLQFAFEQLGAHKVVGMCNSQNKRSIALMERIGMTKEAVFKESFFGKMNGLINTFFLFWKKNLKR